MKGEYGKVHEGLPEPENENKPGTKELILDHADKFRQKLRKERKELE